MHPKLPDFQTVTDAELRALWRKHPDPDVRRLILEVVRYRGVINEVSELHQSIRQAWQRDVGGNLVALHLLHGVVNAEKGRLG